MKKAIESASNRVDRIGLIGKKCGMTRIFTEEGVSIPVTVLEMLPNRVSQVKKTETDGYNAIQVTVGTKKRSKVNKPEAGHFAKANVEPGVLTQEFRVTNVDDIAELNTGSEVTVALFNEGDKVDARGVSKGKGFAGVIKRHHFKSQDETHGNSLTTRAPGSIGQRQSPGRVFKGKKMAGQMGNKYITVQTQEIVKIDSERNLIMIKGGVPGANGGYVVVSPAVKVSA